MIKSDKLIKNRNLPLAEAGEILTLHQPQRRERRPARPGEALRGVL